MNQSMSREQILDLLQYLGARKVKNNDSKDNIQYCCTVHNEDNPSSGVSVDKQIYHCFSCHSSGNFAWLLFNSERDTFRSVREAEEFIKDRYDVDVNAFDEEWKTTGLRRFDDFFDEDGVPVRFEQPIFKIAPFKSGKETYQYFYDRGFNKQDVKDFMIGRDLDQETVTIPVFWEDNVLAGVIGRKIDPSVPKNFRYIVYDFPKSALLYPLNYYKSDRRTVVLVEGNLDAMWCHKHGFTEVQAMQTNALSKNQADWIEENCDCVIDFSDNDSMGVFATESIVKRLKGKVTLLTVKHLYPTNKKDPQECTPEEIYDMLEGAKSITSKTIKRI